MCLLMHKLAVVVLNAQSKIFSLSAHTPSSNTQSTSQRTKRKLRATETESSELSVRVFELKGAGQEQHAKESKALGAVRHRSRIRTVCRRKQS